MYGLDNQPTSDGAPDDGAAASAAPNESSMTSSKSGGVQRILHCCWLVSIRARV